MSLLRLLTAGKSLIGIENPERRFRMSHPGAMPKFGNRTSFRTEAPPVPVGATEDASSGASGVAAAVGVEGNLTGVSACGSGPAEHPESTESGPREFSARSDPGAGPKGIGAWVGNWGAKLSSLAPRKRARPVNTPARRNEAPLQGELSLDNIRVMRNDLSETDLEVVTGKRPEKATAAGDAAEARLEKAQLPAGERAMGKRRGRVAMLFRTGKT